MIKLVTFVQAAGLVRAGGVSTASYRGHHAALRVHVRKQKIFVLMKEK